MNDVDDLAQVLYARFGAGEPENHELWRWHAEGVLASGVVVSARDVKALIDRKEAETASRPVLFGGHRFPAEASMNELRSLLRGPATDAAPTGETQDGDVLADDEALYELLAEGDAWVVVRDSWRPWVVVCNEDGDLWAHSWHQEDEDAPYRAVEDLAYPLTLLARESAVSLPEGGGQRG